MKRILGFLSAMCLVVAVVATAGFARQQDETMMSKKTTPKQDTMTMGKTAMTGKKNDGERKNPQSPPKQISQASAHCF